MGSIYVFSAGNGGTFGDSCAYNGYVNSIYTIPVAAMKENRKISPVSEPCSAIMTSAYSINLVSSVIKFISRSYITVNSSNIPFSSVQRI